MSVALTQGDVSTPAEQPSSASLSRSWGVCCVLRDEQQYRLQRLPKPLLLVQQIRRPADKPRRFFLLFSGCEAPKNLRFKSLTPWRGKKKRPSVNGGRLLFGAPSLGGLITLLLRLAVPIAPMGGNLLVLRFVSIWG